MKYALAILACVLVGCSPVPDSEAQPVQAEVAKPLGPDGCDVDTSSRLVTEHKVSEILNLEKDIDPNGRCTVKFDLIVNGEMYHLEETEVGYEQIPSLCYYARERARKNLLLDLGGKFKSESNITCRIHDES